MTPPDLRSLIARFALGETPLPAAVAAPAEPAAPPASADAERLLLVLGGMVQAEREALRLLLIELRRLACNRPPLMVAFGCLAVAELALLDTGLALEASQYHQLRGYALDVAEAMTAPA